MKAFFRGSLAMLVGSVALLGASTAFAAGEPCFNDTDCPGGGAVCGGDVCNWNKPMEPAADPNKPYTCNPAGTDPKGMDGWCTGAMGNIHCKCAGVGAKCTGIHCSFTKASDAPPAGTGGSGGSGTAGAATGGTPTTTGGTPTTTGGTPTTTGGTPTTTGGTAAKPAAEESSGCSVSSPIGGRGAAALALGLLGLGLAVSRRRR